MTKVRYKTIKAFPETTFCCQQNTSRSEDEMVCPKCTALSEIFTNSPLTIIPDSIPLENLPLKNNNLLLENQGATCFLPFCSPTTKTVGDTGVTNKI